MSNLKYSTKDLIQLLREWRCFLERHLWHYRKTTKRCTRCGKIRRLKNE
jgi:hypothetical protein